jgi:hypothetical protein
MSPLHIQLNRVRRRIWAQLGLAHLSTALLWAASLACVWLVLCRLFPLLRYDLEGAGAILAVGLVAAVWAWYQQRPDMKTAALAADERLGLRERLTSSLELAEHHDPMVDAVHQDALRHVGQIDAGRDFPLMPTRATKWLVLPILLFGVAYITLPEFDLFGYQERELEAKVKTQAQQEKAKRLEKVAKALKAPDKVPLSGLNAKALELESLSEDLKHGKITEKQALAKVKNLRDTLNEEQKALQEKSFLNKAGDKASSSPLTRGLSKDLQQGNMAAAQKKLSDLKKKLKDGKLSENEKKKLASSLKEMAKELEQNDKSQLSQALAAALSKASASLSSNSPDGMKETLESLELSEKELQSVLDQLAQMDDAMKALKEWEKGMMGASPFCRSCGSKLAQCDKGKECEGSCEGKECSGSCSSGQCGGTGYQKGLRLGRGKGAGMGGGGQGEGNQVGELPDVDVAFTPSMLPGQVNEGKMLASIVQKTAPDEDSEANVQIMSGTIVQAQQAAEEALTREEIPRGSEEFVRQYFGTLEADSASE